MNQSGGFVPTRVLPGRALAWVVLVAMLAIVGLDGANAAAPERRTFSNSTTALPPQAVASRRALLAAQLEEPMEFEVALAMRDYASLQARIAGGEIIPHEEMQRLYFPLEAGYQAVAQWLKDQGFTITQTDPNFLSVFARGTVAQIQQGLQVQMARVTVDGEEHSAAESAPSLPAQIAGAVLGINGLQPFHRPHKHLRKLSTTTPGQPPFTVNEILTAYHGTGLGVTGSNQTIAILIDTVPNTSDLTTFWANNGIAQNLANILFINVNNVTLPAVSGEESLDVEWSSGIAPGAQVRVYAAGLLSFTALDKALQRIISDLSSNPQIHQLSISLGLGETYLSSSQFTTDSQYFATLASAGVSIFVSSGDDGSTPNSSGGKTGPLQVEYFASDPSVTSVGGTSLYVSGATGQVTSESAWSGSGGGTSKVFSRPTWQTGTGVPSGTMRLVPDVSLVADPNTGAHVVLNGSVQQFGGTSWSAPTWAGICALINEARATAGKSPLGLLNPRIYPLIGTANFRDITTGSNATSVSGGLYTAGTGYDEVTGIGVPDVATLLQTLLAQGNSPPTIISFTPTSAPVNATVTINGTNLATATAVKFNGTAASTVVSSTQITATVPAGATTGPISVTTPDGNATSSGSFTIAIPTITSFTLKGGVVGSLITITGTSFTGATSVTFNGVAASFTVVSGTQITATVPAGATTGPISVTTPSGTGTSASNFTVTAPTTTQIVISQVYSGGGNTSATYRNDFVELFNRGTTAVNLTGWSLQYASATGTSWSSHTNLSGTIQPGHYFLIAEASSDSRGAVLPAVDATGSINFSTTSGKVVLVSNTTTIPSGTANPSGLASVIDLVGYGSANGYEGPGAAPALSVSTAALRAGGGTTDTDYNTADFSTATPAPRNSASTPLMPDLALTLSHTGTFTQGDVSRTYTINVSNLGNLPTSAAVSVVDAIPSSLTATDITGSGWTTDLGTLTATRSDSLAAGASYPPITVTVNVAANAPTSVTNVATVSGGGDSTTSNNTASDPTVILTPLQTWRQQYFGTTANSGAAADGAVAGGDGLPNLLKYTWGLPPLFPATSPVVVDTTTGHLRLTTPLNPAATDITISVEVSSDLANWTTDGTTIDINTPTLLQVHDATDIGSAPARFIRLRVTEP